MKNEFDVLLVDDDQITRFLHKKIIESFIHHKPVCCEAKNGFEGLQHITNRYAKDKTYPNFILLDISMPLMDGFEFIEKFQSLEFSSKVEIIVVTTSDDMNDIRKIKSYGIKHYLVKPLTTSLLKTTMMERWDNSNGSGSFLQNTYR